MGMLSPLGLDVPSSWEGILAGRSGIAPIEHMDLSAYSTRFGGHLDLKNCLRKEGDQFKSVYHLLMTAPTRLHTLDLSECVIHCDWFAVTFADLTDLDLYMS